MIKIIVPISGGKDSQACLKLALESYPANQILGLFCDTQFEHPLTYQHVENISRFYGVKIEKITFGSVPEIILKNKRFPDSICRFCTRDLKIKPSNKFYLKTAEEQGCGFEVWLGLRTGESQKRARTYKNHICTELYDPHEILDNFSVLLAKLGVYFKLPILNWSTEEVFDYLQDFLNPLYSKGCNRVGCFPCLASGKKNQHFEFNLDEFGKKQQKLVASLSEKVGNVSNNDDLFLGCSFCAI